MAAMQSEDIWDGPVSKAAKKAIKKVEQKLWQVLESLDLKDARKAAKEIAKKKKEKKVINSKAKSFQKITESFKKKQGCGDKPSATARNATLLSSKHDSDVEMDDPDAEVEMELEQTVILTQEEMSILNDMKEKAIRIRRAKLQQKVLR